MGLAASQGRYLCLTARMSDLVYEGQQISQQRMALAKESSAVAEKYNEAMSNRIIQANIIGKDGSVQQQQLTYALITSKDPFAGLGMRIVDLDGNVVIPPQSYTLKAQFENEEEETITQSFDNAVAFARAHMPNLTDEQAEEVKAMDVKSFVNFYKENYPDSDITLTAVPIYDDDIKNDNERYLHDENCTDPAYLQEMLTTGQWLLQQAVPVTADNESGWDDVMWQGSSQISDVLDTSDDAAAQAEYETAMKEIQRKDKLLELRLEEVQTEESSVEKEIESIKGVIKKNIEDSFGTFA